MHATTVTIGRNVKDTPMSDEDWSTFKLDVLGAMLETFPPYTPEFKQGVGHWQGIEEESASFTVLHHDEWHLTTLRERLREFLVTYRQEAIALVSAPSELIELPEVQTTRLRFARGDFVTCATIKRADEERAFLISQGHRCTPVLSCDFGRYGFQALDLGEED
jgi:hypothetical protein